MAEETPQISSLLKLVFHFFGFLVGCFLVLMIMMFVAEGSLLLPPRDAVSPYPYPILILILYGGQAAYLIIGLLLIFSFIRRVTRGQQG